nr:hypothetical protein [uncultured Dorea sp.]
MKKIVYILLDLLTVVFMIGAYAVQYFTRKKLGMLRWVNYQNMQIQKNAVYGILKYITVVVAIIFIVMIIAGYKKKKAMMRKLDLVMIVIMSLLGIFYLGITVLKSIEVLPAYYFLMPLVGAAVLMQIIRNGIAVGTKKNEK